VGGKFDELLFDPPAGFVAEDSQIVFRAQDVDLISTLAMRQSQLRPNLLVQRRRLKWPTTAEAFAQTIHKELRVLQTLADFVTAPFEFIDGREGVLLTYHFVASPGIAVDQWQVIRVDPPSIATLGVMTVPRTGVSREALEAYRRSLASIRPATAD